MPIYVAGTCDTKGRELAYVKELIVADGVAASLVDLSTSVAHGNARAADVSAEAVAHFHPQGVGAVFTGDRGTAVLAMAEAFERFMLGRNDVSGLIGLGGSGGTALVTPAMRALAVGVPKLMVSTVASGNVAPYVGASDIAMMYSVTDVAGLNRISRVVLANAAHAIAGMVRAATNAQAGEESAEKCSLGITMFGVTTPCVTELARVLDNTWDCLVFHATGTGGRAMEKLVDSRLMAGVIDVTTTEVADLLVGGVFPCGEDRFGAVRRTETPCVVSCGALDMVNFGAMDTVPEAFRQRLLYRHNPQVTLMRTTPEENTRIGEWIAGRLDLCPGPLRIVIPERGVSALDAPGMPFEDAAADAALFSCLEKGIRATANRQVIRLPLHINDPAFAGALAAQFSAIAPTLITRVA